jgi:hypothetical protein
MRALPSDHSVNLRGILVDGGKRIFRHAVLRRDDPTAKLTGK